MEKKPIVTQHIYPPIPVREFDWCAYRDGNEEGTKGWGRTQAEAVTDLTEREAEEGGAK